MPQEPDALHYGRPRTPFEERTGDPRRTHGGLTASRKSLWPHSTSSAALFFSSAFQSSPLAKPRTEITGLGPPFPAPSLPLSYSHLHKFPSAGRLSRTNRVPWTTEVLQPAQQTGHREAAPTSWWPLALLAFPGGEHDPLSHPSSLPPCLISMLDAPPFRLMLGTQEVSSNSCSPRASSSPAAEPLLHGLPSHVILLAFNHAAPISCGSTASSHIGSGGR